MKWIYISPHLDDAVFSCGGTIWEQICRGEAVEIWTMCAGDPPPGLLTPFAETLHQRWGTGFDSLAERRTEDYAAAAVLGASIVHFDIPDCIYRRLPSSGEPLIQTEEDLWSPVHPEEEVLVHTLGERIRAAASPDSRVVCPLGIGGHVDHQLTRSAVVSMCQPVFYYAEYPYSASPAVDIADWLVQTCYHVSHPLSNEGILAWEKAVAQYTTQISTFWSSLEEMRSSLRKYALSDAATTLWYSSDQQ